MREQSHCILTSMPLPHAVDVTGTKIPTINSLPISREMVPFHQVRDRAQTADRDVGTFSVVPRVAAGEVSKCQQVRLSALLTSLRRSHPRS